MTKITEAYQLNAFGLTASGGNTAGIVLNAATLKDEEMLAIAKKLGFSETAFILPSKICDFKIRFFTPAREVDLCGHATIAAYSLLFQLGKLPAGIYSQELLAGLLEVRINERGQVFMEQSLPQFGPQFSPESIAPLLGLKAEDLSLSSLPIQVVSTGLSDIFVALPDRDLLESVQPDFEQIRAFNHQSNTVGFHVFAFDTTTGSTTATCRNFAPLYEINEEAATGSSCGALGCYLHRYWQPESHFEFEQGLNLGQPSKIIVDLESVEGEISKVIVSGFAGKPEILQGI
ncbi:MAG: phenazine biosynthesis protein PhzF family [SAR324 cluster bacterium]|uniref:Phenazine biosynthesis protein PhzF family n=1 Tax=SAR324 cluster bacterium TaxID=2024889 RepID=A0A2A4T4N3_9DELT|nr:MAG: phenazine biosynthesis protein PhzF family [SAR324 cluster bacterium]